MATVPIQVPGVGESISEGILSRWLKPDGAAVKAGEPLFELETDKASTPVPSPADGVLKISAPEGSTVAIGSTVGTLDPDAKPSAPAAAGPRPAAQPAAEAPRPAPATPAKPEPAASSPNGGTGAQLSP